MAFDVQTYEEAGIDYGESDLQYNGFPVVTLHHSLSVSTVKIDSVDDGTCDDPPGTHAKPLDHSVDINDPAGGNAEAGTDVIFRASAPLGTVTGEVTSSGGDACTGTSLGGDVIKVDILVSGTKVGHVIYRHVDPPAGGYPSGTLAVDDVVAVVSDDYTSDPLGDCAGGGCYPCAHIHMDWSGETVSTVEVECLNPLQRISSTDQLGTLRT